MNQTLSPSSAVKLVSLLSISTLRLVMSLTSDLGVFTLTYPVVPVGSETVKLKIMLAELNASAESVELDVTEKTLS